MDLTNVEELEDLHFKPKRGINEKQHQICHLTDVDHAVDFIVTLKECYPPLLANDQSYRTWMK